MVVKFYQIIKQVQSMSYYNPIYPSIDATRNEIQRSILELQDKLRLRRQIDLDIQLSRNNDIARRAAYQDQLYYRQALANTDRFYATAYEKAVAQKFRYAQQEQSQNLKHLARIQQLQKQRLQLERQRLNSVLHKTGFQSDGISPFKKVNYGHGYDQDQTLIKKYQDGTRARQYIDQIDSFGNSRQKYSSAAKNNSQKGTGSQFNRSPYNNLRYDSERNIRAQQTNNPLTNNRINGNNQSYRNYQRNNYIDYDDQNEPRFGQRQQRNTDRSKGQPKGIIKNGQFSKNKQKNGQNQTELKQKSNTKTSKSLYQKETDNRNDKTFGYAQKLERSTTPKKKGNAVQRNRSRSQKQLNSSKRKAARSDYSPYLSYIDPNVQRSPAKSKRSGTKNQNQRSRLMGPPQISAMQKIKNRLKVSEIVYKDSKFKNVKHQLSHLFNTYDCQTKLRKDIKQKINSHPIVLKKHAMVVQ